MKLALFALGFTLWALPAQAEELSPWFGSEESQPFQVAVDVSARLAVAEIPVSPACELPDCPPPPNLANGTASAEAP